LGVCTHVWVASQAAVLHSLEGEQGVVTCAWAHDPASQPAAVQLLLSVSPQGVLSPTGATPQPVTVLHVAVLH